MEKDREMEQESLSTRISRQMEEAGLQVVVEVQGDTVTLTGHVDSNEARQAAEDIALSVAPDRRIDNDVEVEVTSPNNSDRFRLGEPGPNDPPPSVDHLESEGSDLAPDFTDQPLATTTVDTLEGMLPSGQAMSDYQNEDDMDEPSFFPPTDPVVRINDAGDTEVLGGFSPDSMDEIEVERSALDNLPGDEAIAEAIGRELQEDAITTDLDIFVTVRNGIARLRGVVPTLEDAENVEAIARRVPGVQDVDDDLEVVNL